MNLAFFQNVETALAAERLDAFRQDGVGPLATLARYIWNMALCEALYSPLQISEIALRNVVHCCLSKYFQDECWYDKAATLPDWQKQQLEEALEKVRREGKPVTAGRIVAELHFGFWTGFFNKAHARTGLGHLIAQQAFTHAPREERDIRRLDARWRRIRELRNSVFHHERIIHWNDLDAQHAELLEMIRWASPELQKWLWPWTALAPSDRRAWHLGWIKFTTTGPSHEIKTCSQPNRAAPHRRPGLGGNSRNAVEGAGC